MSEALRLPAHPDLEQYKKLAEDLQRACKSSDADAIREWAGHLAGIADGEAHWLRQRWIEFKRSDENAARCELAAAQFFLARSHGFASWPKFTEHVGALARAESTISLFEQAADAIVKGDREALEKLLGESPDLARARSAREHGSALLHHVSANGIEDFRQKTPPNIVEIAKLLLDAGADVNAESGAYGGRSTTLALTATSCHPENAGLQIPLMELLIENGAALDGPDGSSTVNACLRNGRGEAAEFLASRGAMLDLEGAAGVGRLDLVASYFEGDGRLKTPATARQMRDAFAWACQFGKTGVVDFLLQKGMEIDAKLKHHGQTGLHWAAYGGHADTVKLLLERGAPIDARDARFNGTALGWALHAWSNAPERKRGGYYEVAALLVQAGARLDDEEKPQAAAIDSDPRMKAALGGEMPR
jgi:hypothetical protein